MTGVEYILDFPTNFAEDLDKQIKECLKILDLESEEDNIWENAKNNLEDRPINAEKISFEIYSALKNLIIQKYNIPYEDIEVEGYGASDFSIMIKEDDDNYIDLSSSFNNFQDFLEFYIKRYHFEDEEREILNEIIDIVNKENEDIGTDILNDFIEKNYSYYNALALEVFELFINEFLKDINQYLEEDEIGFRLYLDDELNLKKEKI
jgi:hypothetical protein